MVQDEALRIHLKPPLSEHQKQILENLSLWERKPVLRRIYRGFHETIASRLSSAPGETVELGSGIGNIREVIPRAVRTDLFPNPWIDRTEDIYRLSMGAETCANLILFDVFHHLEHPMDALDECHRVLQPGGRLLVFDHAMSLAGFLFSKFVHHEKAGFSRPFRLRGSESQGSELPNYYADHANADRILCRGFRELLAKDWRMVETIKMPALAWLASGGYRGPCWIQNPEGYGWKLGEIWLSQMPAFFALRLLVVLEKKSNEKTPK